MVNPAVLAGLLAGYTVGAVVTAFVVAKEPAAPAGPANGLSRTVTRPIRVTGDGLAHRTRRSERCARTHEPSLPVTTRRR